MVLQRRKSLSTPRKWTEEEEAILLGYLQGNNFSGEDIRKLLPSRSMISIRSKTRKLRIKYDLFGESYRDIKQAFTEKIACKIKPNVVYEAYAGAGHQTLTWIHYSDAVFATDNSTNKRSQFSENILASGFEPLDSDGPWNRYGRDGKTIHFFCGDTIDAAANLRANRVHVDLIDLDTCGSTLPILPLLLALLAPHHLTITHGEFHSLRFSREDVLRRILSHRSIDESPLPMTLDQLAIELDRAVKVASLRAHNETCDSFWATLEDEIWLGSKAHGMLRRYYSLRRPVATADCINEVSRTVPQNYQETALEIV